MLPLDVDVPPLVQPPLPDALLARLKAFAAHHGGALPGGEALHAKLGKPGAPAAAWTRMAQAMHQEWIKPRSLSGDELHGLFIATVALGWRDLPEAERLRGGLYPAVIRALGAQGDADALSGLASRLAPFAADPAADVALSTLLRQLRQHHRPGALAALLDALQPAFNPERAWSGPVLSCVLALTRDADDFATLRRAASWLPALFDAADQAATDDSPPWRDLGKLALRVLQVPAMQRAGQALLNDQGLAHADTQPLLLQLLLQLAGFAPDATTRGLLSQAATQHPGHPAIQLARARIAHREGAAMADIEALLDGLDDGLAAWPHAMSWLASTRFHDGDEAGAMAIYRQLAARGALSVADRLRMNHMSSREDKPADEPASASSDPTPPEPVHAWAGEAVEPFIGVLGPLMALLDSPPHHDAALTLSELQAQAEAALAHWRDALPQLNELSLKASLRFARHLRQLEAGAFAHHTHWVTAFPFELGPAYGRVDAQRCRLLSHTVQRHIVALCDVALQRPRALRGGPGQASLRHVLDLAEQRAESQWALGEPADAAAALEALGETLGSMGEVPLRELKARAALTQGRLSDAAALLGTDDEVLPLQDWDAWLATEGLQPQTLIDDAAIDGDYESVTMDGVVHRYRHRVVRTQMTVVHHTDLRVRDSHLLIGPLGGILRPGAWHLSMGDYPYEHRHVRLRGGGLRSQGAVLRRACWQRIETPVVVLANMDATYHRNFYHWMLLLLARIEAVRARGLLLGGRQLLLPRELSGWMRSSLADIGITDEQILSYGDSDDLVCSDALLVSPIDFACPSLVEGLRQTLWRCAGLDPDVPPAATRLLYISRRGEGRRPLVDEARIQQAAEAMGFDAVSPETLTLGEQVRLFATARGIAGPPGAAYTNLCWAQPGTRVLSIFKEEANLPTFIDLSLIRGQSHRWLLGRNLAGYALMSIVNAPFSVDLSLAERELAWVAGESEQP
ncbi:glycosyltransferase family 61 protein [Ideonella sp. DXS29W]|uniref:Glycosyltransferase family 61 protein n=1 Tax=Ideonella lacteola TaxID=2984193 RepID=A0ABU9BLH8_9BURK